MACHSDRVKSGGLALSGLNLDAADQNAEIAEKVIRKLRGGLMPPAGAKRPDSQSRPPFVSWLENEIDSGGCRRASRDACRCAVSIAASTRNAIRDLIGLNIDAQACCPTTTSRATSTTTPPRCRCRPTSSTSTSTRRAPSRSRRSATRKALAETTTYGDVANMVISLPPSGAPGTGRQQHRLEGMPFGTRGGFIVEHNFPADGEYELTIGDMALAREVPRMEFENTVIALLDGKEFYRTTIGGDADHKAIDQTLDPAVEEINGRLRKIRFKAPAGQHKLAITFVHRSFAESDERMRTSALEGGQERIQAAHALQIRGPLSVTGMSGSASRAKIFICQPPPGSAAAVAEREQRMRAARSSRTSRGARSGVR